MVKRMLRKVIRRVHKATLDFLRDDEVVDGQSDIADPWLRQTLLQIERAGGTVMRPAYSWGVLCGAYLAKALKIDRVSVVEFGVAGGNGLIALEKAAEQIEPILEVGIDVYGFDTGVGLPKPTDYRDLPNLYTETAYRMDEEKLRARLRRSHLHLGLIADTLGDFIALQPAPVAFVSIDVDYYSSTTQAFKLLEADESLLLPRVYFHFDDILGATHSEFTGERLAISEFNASHPLRKISPIFALRYYLPIQYRSAQWPEKMYLFHWFDHPLYCANDGLVKRIVGVHTDLKEQ
jgi:hypothetical protein